jgi:hypothetical protein
MNRIEDERVRFYLRHQEEIDAWTALAKLLHDRAHEFLLSCKPGLDRLAAELGTDVHCTYLEHAKWPSYNLYQASWIPIRVWTHPEWPPMAVGIIWHRPTVTFKGAGSPLVGVWLRGDRRPDEQLIAAFHSRCDKPRDGFSKRDAWGAAVHAVSPPNEDYCDNLQPFRESIVESVRAAWHLYAHDIPQILKVVYG